MPIESGGRGYISEGKVHGTVGLAFWVDIFFLTIMLGDVKGIGISLLVGFLPTIESRHIFITGCLDTIATNDR